MPIYLPNLLGPISLREITWQYRNSVKKFKWNGVLFSPPNMFVTFCRICERSP